MAISFSHLTGRYFGAAAVRRLKRHKATILIKLTGRIEQNPRRQGQRVQINQTINT